MEFFPILDMIWNYFTKSIQEYRFIHIRNIILVIHEDEIISYNALGRAILEERKIKIEREK